MKKNIGITSQYTRLDGWVLFCFVSGQGRAQLGLILKRDRNTSPLDKLRNN